MSRVTDGEAEGPRKLADLGRDTARRRRRAAIAGHVGDEAAARALLDDGAATVRATALGALARCGAVRPGDVRVALVDPDPAVRIRAVTVVADLDRTADGPLAAVTLLPLLDDADPSVAEAAAWATGERVEPEPGAVARLAALATGHDDPLVREAAVGAIGAIGDPAGLRAVLAATRDRATVRRRAVLALAPFTGSEVDAALTRARTDRDWQVRQAAEDLS